MKMTIVILVLALLALVLLTAYTPGGKAPLLRVTLTPTFAPVEEVEQQAAPRMMPPRLRGTQMPPPCNTPGGPRC